jgi:hypothetical protein
MGRFRVLKKRASGVARLHCAAKDVPISSQCLRELMWFIPLAQVKMRPSIFGRRIATDE